MCALSFADIIDDMNLAEDYVKYVVRYVLENCLDDVKFFNERVDKEKVRLARAAVLTIDRSIPAWSATVNVFVFVFVFVCAEAAGTAAAAG